MSNWYDPIDSAIKARAGDVPVPQVQGSSAGDAAFAAQASAPQGGAMQMGAMRAPTAQTNSNDTPTPYAWNPTTKQLLAGGNVVPKDITAYEQALADPNALAPMSSAQLSEHGFIPLSHAQLTSFVTNVQKNANAPVLHNAWEGAKEGASAIMEGLDRAVANDWMKYTPQGYVGNTLRDALGMGQYEEQAQQVARDRIAQRAVDMPQDRIDARQALTLEQQAGQDARFSEHPGTFVAGRLGTFAGSAGPLIAATAVNPALGAGAVITQSAGGSAMDSAARIQAALNNATPEQLLQESPTYAALRQQGLDDNQARDYMVRAGGDRAALVGGAVGAATIPLFDMGARGVSALAPSLSRMAGNAGDGFIVRALTGQGLAGTATRAAVRGTEGAGLMSAQSMVSNAAGAGAAGVGSTNPLDYFDPSQFAESALGFGAMGAITPMAPRRMNPQEVAAASDIGAAVRAMDTSQYDRPAAPGGSDHVQPIGPQDLPNRMPDPTGLGEAMGSIRAARQEGADIAAQQMGRPAMGDLQAMRQQGMSIEDIQAMLSNPRRAPDLSPGTDPRPLFGPGPADAVDNRPTFAPGNDTRPVQGPQPDMRPEFAPGNAGPELAPGNAGPVQGPQPTYGPLIRRRMMEQARDRMAAQEMPGRPAELPAPDANAPSAQQSLDLVNQMLEQGNFNKRTKKGRETLVALQAEKTRLEAQVASEAQPQPQPAQPQAPVDPRLTGELPPVGARPGDSVEPPPIPNPEPMSPQEQQARLATQASRDGGDRVVPPPMDAQAAVQTSREGVSPSTPEPAADLAAQAAALGKTRDALFVAAGNEGQIPKVRRGVRKIERPEGTLFTTNADKAKIYREAPTVNDALLARLQDLPESKADAIAKGDAAVTQAVDAKGNVVKEALGTVGGPNEAAVAAAVPKGGRVRRVTADQAQARRADMVEQPARSRLDLIKDAAAKKRAEAPLKKKVDLAEVTPKGAVDPATVRKAEADLNARVEAEAPHLLRQEDRDQQSHEGGGRTRETTLTRLPLLPSELHELGERLHATAQAEQLQIEAGGWNARDSVMRRVLEAIGARGTDTEMRAAVREFASMSDTSRRQFITRVAPMLADASIAKEIVRGADAVRAAQPKNEAAARASTAEPADAYNGYQLSRQEGKVTPPPQERSTANAAEKTGGNGRATTYGKVPENVADVVQQWSKVVEKTSGRVLPDHIHIMTPEGFRERYGVDVKTENVLGQAGKMGNDNVIVMSQDLFKDQPAMLETLAHEMGHIITDSILGKVPKEDHAAIMRAYNDWRTDTGRLSPTDQQLDRMPPALQKIMRDQMRDPTSNLQATREYAESFREWVADETAKWLNTDQRPRSAVERFFAKLADALKSIYAQVMGNGSPTEAVRRMFDNWVERSRPLAVDDAAARTAQLNYNEVPAQPVPASEAIKARAGAERTKAAFDVTREEAVKLGETLKAVTGSREDLTRALHNTLAALPDTRAGHALRKLGLGLSSLRDLEARFAKTKDRNSSATKDEDFTHGAFGKGLFDYLHAKRLADADAREASQAMQLSLEKALNLSAPVESALRSLMYKSTIYGVHPDEAFGAGRNKHLASSDSTVNTENQRRWGEVRAAWDKLQGISGDPQAIYKAMRDSMFDARERYFEAQRTLLDKNQDIPAEAKEQAHRMINLAEEAHMSGPYFPLIREGSFITTAEMPMRLAGEFNTMEAAKAEQRRQEAMNPHANVSIAKTPDGYDVHVGEKAVYFHNSIVEAKQARQGIMDEMQEAWGSRGDFKKLNAEAIEAGQPSLISNPVGKVDYFRKFDAPTNGSFMHTVNDLAANNKITHDVHTALSQMYLDSLPEFALRKGFLHRENVRGASMNMTKAYSQRMTQLGRAIGTLENSKEISDGWSAMNKNRGVDPAYADVLNSLNNREKVIAERMRPTAVNRAASIAQDASSFKSLAFSPMFLAQQALQPFVVSLPVLAAKMGADGRGLGLTKASQYLMDAYKGAGFFMERGRVQFGHELSKLLGNVTEGKTMQETGQELIQRFGKTDDEKHLLKYMADRGTLDFSFLNAMHDAASMTKVGEKAKALSRLSMAFPQQVEAMNRTMTALATFRAMTKEGGLSPEAATRMADSLVAQTHGDYSRMNRPSIFNRPLPGMALQFKIYTQTIYSLFIHNFATAVNRNASQADRAEAWRTLRNLLASHAAVGGAAGLGPVATGAKLALGMALMAGSQAGLVDKKKKDQSLGDYVGETFEHLGDEVFGKGNGHLLRKVGAFGGFGALDMTLGQNLGIPSLMSDSRYSGGNNAREQPGDWMDQQLVGLAGAPYSNIKQVANGVADIAHGRWKNASKNILPSAGRAVINAVTEAQDGVVSPSGEVIRARKDMSPIEVAARFLNIGSAETQMAYDKRANVRDTGNEIKAEQQDLRTQYAQAKTAEERAAARKAILQYNAGRPSALRITQQSLDAATKPRKDSTFTKAVKAVVGQ